MPDIVKCPYCGRPEQSPLSRLVLNGNCRRTWYGRDVDVLDCVQYQMNTLKEQVAKFTALSGICDLIESGSDEELARFRKVVFGGQSSGRLNLENHEIIKQWRPAVDSPEGSEGEK